MSSLYQNDYIYDKHIYEKPYTYDNPYMTYSRASPEGNESIANLNDNQRHCERPIVPQHSYRPVQTYSQQHRHELITSAVNLSSDVTLNAILRNSGYISSTMDRNPLKQSFSRKQKPGLKASTIHSGHRCRPLPSLPSVIYNTGLSSTLRHSPHHRPRSELLSTLSSIHSTDSKGPLRPFWETHLYDKSDNSVCDSVSVGDTSAKTKGGRVCRWTAISVICLAIVLISMSCFVYFMVSRNVNFWDESESADETNKYSMIETEFLDNQQKDERYERGSKIILGEFTISNRMFISALKDKSSPEFSALEEDVIKSNRIVRMNNLRSD